MNGYPPFAGANGSATPSQPRASVDLGQNGFRPQDRNGMPISGAGQQRPMGGFPPEPAMGRMNIPRSPPKNKNTQLVPCKFFLQGTCQAGRTCPFSHDVEASFRPAPCKYFSRGHCKFGTKCALLHITADGTVLNPRPTPFAPGLPGAVHANPPPGYLPHPTPSLLSLQAQGLDQRPPPDAPPDFEGYSYTTRNGYDQPIDMTYTSPSPTYGSPPHENRFATSPTVKGLSVLDAPLPNSFDSNGISLAARNGPFAASVPSRFGVESPPASLPRKSQLGNTALRDLQNSVGMDRVLAGTSPPSGPDEPLTFEKRPLHSARLRAPQFQPISASLGTKLPTQSFEYSDDEDQDDDTDRHESLLPSSLHDLIPEGFSKREARSQVDNDNISASGFTFQRRTVSGTGASQEGRFGSPLGSSPSRFAGMIRSVSGRDGDGLVGSPLRNSSSYFPTSAPRTNGDADTTWSSPPRQASMSMLTKDLQRTKLDAASSSVGMTRTLSSGSNGRTSLDRGLSSTSIGRERIEEEELFDMEEVDASRPTVRVSDSTNQDYSANWASGRQNGTPAKAIFGAIGGHRMPK